MEREVVKGWNRQSCPPDRGDFCEPLDLSVDACAQGIDAAPSACKPPATCPRFGLRNGRAEFARIAHDLGCADLRNGEYRHDTRAARVRCQAARRVARPYSPGVKV